MDLSLPELGQLSSNMADGPLEPILVEGFEQVVDRVNFKGIESVGVVSGDEDYQWQWRTRGRYRAADLDPAQTRHLDIKENQVRPFLLDKVDRLIAVGAFAGQAEIRFVLEKLADARASRRFVIHD
jgi:hypothetical protein